MTHELTSRKLLTVVCEASLERAIVADLARLGARGCTITDARGHGAHGERDGLWPPSANIRIEILCDLAVAEAIALNLKSRYYAQYSMVIFIADVQVLRPDKF
jgi:hypothetical protein